MMVNIILMVALRQHNNSPRALKLRRHHISYLFQNFALVEDESIEKNLNVSLLYAKVSKKEKRRK